MQIRSNTMWLRCATIARLLWVAIVAFVIAGCQSNSERDLMARDRRMQEDQMWAMQDHIQQYQQLVCQFRSENASLRRQLNDERSGGAMQQGSQPVPRTPVGPPPSNNQRQAPSPNMDSPDVPPLGQGVSIGAGSWMQRYADSVSKQNNDRYAQLASYETPADSSHVHEKDQPPSPIDFDNRSRSDLSKRDSKAIGASPDILLSGEVVANENGGGPRLVIDVETFDDSGRIAKFNGAVSLALLASDNGVQRRIARWDFGPDEARAAVNVEAGESTMRFLVELPSEVKIEGPTELWVKLAPTVGERQFSHAKLKLTKPGVFSSRSDRVWASEESVVAASYEVPSTPSDSADIESDAAATVNESDWSTARPGKPATLPVQSNESPEGWRAASGPVPAVVATANPSPAFRNTPPQPIEPAPAKSASAQSAPVDVAKKPSWAPERPGRATRTARPSWSANR